MTRGFRSSRSSRTPGGHLALHAASTLASLAAASVTLASPPPPTVTADGLFPRTLTRLQEDRDEMKRWSYVESNVLERRTPDGRVHSRTTEVYEVFFEDGRRMRRPLSLDMAQDSQGLAIFRREEDRFLPQGLQDGPARPMKDSPFEVETLVRCYRFDSQGRDTIAGRPAVKLGFAPVDGCLDDGSRAGRLLQNLAGTLWIDEHDSDILKIEGSLERPVTFGFGLLGRIEDFTLEVQREALAPGLYAMTHVDYRARGTSFIFHRFDVRSIRDRSAFLRTPERQGTPHPSVGEGSSRKPSPRPPAPP